MWTRRFCENSHYEHPSHEYNVDEFLFFALLSVTASNSIVWDLCMAELSGWSLLHFCVLTFELNFRLA
jgi:hypothetical protein